MNRPGGGTPDRNRRRLVQDSDGNIGSDDVVITVVDPGGVDQDGDGYPVANDCDDTDPYRSPMSLDDPDMGYVDDNCDGIDGDELNSVFLDPIGGADANTGLTTGSPKRTLTAALQTANANGRDWVLVSLWPASLDGMKPVIDCVDWSTNTTSSRTCGLTIGRRRGSNESSLAASCDPTVVIVR